LEGELGPEQSTFAQGCQRDFDQLPCPDLPLTVGLDGGYVHSSAQTSRRDGWFEVIAGKSMPDEGPAKCFAFVQTIDTKPKRRLFEVLRLKFHRYQPLDPSPRVQDLLDYLDKHADPIFWG